MVLFWFLFVEHFVLVVSHEPGKTFFNGILIEIVI